MRRALAGLLMAAIAMGTTVSAAPAQARTVVIESRGSGKNSAEALLAAKTAAAQQAIESLLICQAEKAQWVQKRRRVVDDALVALQQYHTRQTDTPAEGNLQVAITAEFSETALYRSLIDHEILLSSRDKPTLLLIVSGNEDEKNALLAVEDSLRSFLEGRCGFTLIDKSVSGSIRSSDQQMSRVRYEVSSAAAVGSDYDADILIDCRASSIRLENASEANGEMKSVRAEVALRVINCASGSAVGIFSSHATGRHLSPDAATRAAMQAAAYSVTREALDPILENWDMVLANGIPLSITVQEVESYREKNAVLRTLQSIPGVTAVHHDTWQAAAGALDVDVSFRGTAGEFSSRADGFKMSRRGGSFAVTGISGRQISLVVQAK